MIMSINWMRQFHPISIDDGVKVQGRKCCDRVSRVTRKIASTRHWKFCSAHGVRNGSRMEKLATIKFASHQTTQIKSMSVFFSLLSTKKNHSKFPNETVNHTDYITNHTADQGIVKLWYAYSPFCSHKDSLKRKSLQQQLAFLFSFVQSKANGNHFLYK